jgi:hypothetical protein
LVQQLMHFGWYRIGPGPTDGLGRETWGFQEGHVIPGSTQSPIWVPAPAELVAMRILLTVVQTRA